MLTAGRGRVDAVEARVCATGVEVVVAITLAAITPVPAAGFGV